MKISSVFCIHHCQNFYFSFLSNKKTPSCFRINNDKKYFSKNNFYSAILKSRYYTKFQVSQTQSQFQTQDDEDSGPACCSTYFLFYRLVCRRDIFQVFILAALVAVVASQGYSKPSYTPGYSAPAYPSPAYAKTPQYVSGSR